MNLYQLYYFKTMANLEHYTKAAEELSMTQPSLSNAISALESELEIHLFEKQGRNVKLSKYGKKLLPYVDNAIAELETGIKMVKEMKSEANSLITLGFIYTLSSEFIPNVINCFRNKTQQSNINFSLKEAWTKDACTDSLVKGLKEEKYDLIFISLIPNDPEIEFVPIFEQNLVVLLPNNCPLSSQTSVDLRDTAPYPIIHYSGKVGLKKEINRLFDMVDMVPNIYCEVEDEVSMAGLVSANVGMAIVPYNPTLHNYQGIKILPISNPFYSRKIYIGYMKNRYMCSAVKKFKDHVVETAKIYN
ncbi:LysR family transcriptional regulator [Bacillus sp. T3]|uniref:LysR family transcriptional regulator n=1 Tax=Bacillus sp. T3 TaxID=467262 RepID=UPI00298109F2|nr:LysR family transcriptional regulator [Bacillus sp. T3]